MDKLDFPGVVLPRTPEVLALYSQQLLTVLSSAVIGGGMVRVRYLLNRHVRHDYNCLAPGADLVAFARSQSISEAFVGQKAGVSLQKARTSIGKSNGLFHRPPRDLVLGSARTLRASGWPVLDAAGRPLARPPGRGLGTERQRGWGCAAGDIAPQWVQAWVPQAWYDRLGSVIEPVRQSVCDYGSPCYSHLYNRSGAIYTVHPQTGGQK